jgi:hypothetical protein
MEHANIGPREARKRVLLGLVMATAAVGLAVVFSRAGASPGWYLALFPPFWGGTLGLLQARRKT